MVPGSEGSQPARSGRLSESETAKLLALDVPAHLATIDRDGFPRITPIWFIWADGTFHLTGVPSRRYLHDLERDPHASICIDTEQSTPIAGQRPNRQLRARGMAEVLDDLDGEWTRRITLKYIPGNEGRIRAEFRASMQRRLVRLRPERLLAFGTA